MSSSWGVGGADPRTGTGSAHFAWEGGLAICAVDDLNRNAGYLDGMG